MAVRVEDRALRRVCDSRPSAAARSGRWWELTAVLAVALVLSAGVAAAARADGDPASDILASDTLPFHDVFLPLEPVSPELAQKLRNIVEMANKSGFRIKVALIASPADLGSVTVLFNMPEQYAKFLGAELLGLYQERLLVVMPAGFGLFRGGKPTASELESLSTIAIQAGADGLAQAAIDAVQRLDDREPPTVKAQPASARRGRGALLRYTVTDDSGFASIRVRVAHGRTRIASFSVPLRAVQIGKVSTIRWVVPTSTPRSGLSFCALALDPAGNQSRESCAPITIR